MEIVNINIDKITPYEGNAKIHTKEQIEQIKKSIENFEMNDPIAVWGENNLVIEGHGRLEALKELGYTEVPCIRLDHLTEEQRKAYTLVHNKLTMNTGFNLDLLQEELDNIASLDMSDFGFEALEDIDLDQFFEDKEETEKEDNEEIEEPEEIQCPHCKMWFTKE